MFTVPGIVQHAFPSLVWRYKTNEKKIFLTFDDGPIQGITNWVLAELKKYGASATFFCVGENVDQFPELVKSIKSHGHSIGNHTYNHLNGWKYSTNNYLDNIEKCDKSISSCSVDSNLFRPPYGKLNLFATSRIKQSHKIIMWNLISKDYSSKYSPEFLLENLYRLTKPGSVVVFHDSLKAETNLRYILPKYLSFLNDNGFRMESISE